MLLLPCKAIAPLGMARKVGGTPPFAPSLNVQGDHRNNAFRGTSRLDGRYRPGREGIIAMNSQDLGAALLAICVVGIAVGLSSIKAGDEYCPSPSAASVTALFAPCQTFDSAMGRSISKEEAVQMGLVTPDLQPKPATQ